MGKNVVKFSTFAGVFTPCTLTILGVIMFLRLGQVVGHSGVIFSVLIILAAKIITTLTALSLSAIATNTRVKGGGAYYLISRSLGVEFGGAIGVVFYLAQAISVALYVIGFTEAFVNLFPSLDSKFIEIATVVNLLTFICVYVGASWAIKIQYGILVLLGLSLFSFFAEAVPTFDTELFYSQMNPEFQSLNGLFVMFALFFPAVTGIMAGANMSGDLKNPARSIPRGTLYSVLFTGIIYLALALLLAGTAPREKLLTSNLIMKEISIVPWLISAGVFAATLSSALGSMMGAPRILQAFARDEIFLSLRFFGTGSGINNEPRRATVLTFIIAQCCIILGDLNAIAPIITMFFMVTYGLINLATFYETVTRNPSYRPTFRYCPWYVSLAGAIGCFAVMILINWSWAIISLAVLATLHRYISRKEILNRWGDLQSGIVFERARRSLLRLEEEAYHPKNWRPIILALSGKGGARPELGIYGHWLTAGHGVLSLGQVVQGDPTEFAGRRSAFESTLRNFITRAELQAFSSLIISENVSSGIQALVQTQGIGELKPNTILLGWPNDPERVEPFGSSLRLISNLGKSLVCARFKDEFSDNGEDSDEQRMDTAWEVPRGTIDVWWRGQHNGSLMLLLAHLIHQNPEWRANPIRLLRVADNQEAEKEILRHLNELSNASRIKTEVKVVIDKDWAKAIRETSKEAAVVIIGFEPPEDGEDKNFYERVESTLEDLPRVLLVNSAGGVELDS